jgi:hypothetical protein
MQIAPRRSEALSVNQKRRGAERNSAHTIYMKIKDGEVEKCFCQFLPVNCSHSLH